MAIIAAFHDLSTTRIVVGTPIGLVPWQIPWDRIHMYGREALGLSGDALKSFIFVIRELDNAWLAWEGKRLASLMKS